MAPTVTRSKNIIYDTDSMAASNVTIKIQKPIIEKKYEINKQTPKVELNEEEDIIIALSLLHEKRTNSLLTFLYGGTF